MKYIFKRDLSGFKNRINISVGQKWNKKAECGVRSPACLTPGPEAGRQKQSREGSCRLVEQKGLGERPGA